MDTFIYLLITAAYMILFIIGLFLTKKNGLFKTVNVLLLVILALLYDNATLAFGKYIGESQVLEQLNLARYWLHALITPLLVLFAWKSLVNATFGWARTSIAKWIAIFYTLALISVELMTVVFGLTLESSWEFGVLSYESTESAVPIMIIGVMLVLLVASILILWKQKWIWFLLGVLVMWIGAMIDLPIPSSALTNGFELLLITSLVATKAYQDQKVL